MWVLRRRHKEQLYWHKGLKVLLGFWSLYKVGHPKVNNNCSVPHRTQIMLGIICRFRVFQICEYRCVVRTFLCPPPAPPRKHAKDITTFWNECFNARRFYSPLMRILRRLLRTVVQFQRRFRNWYWHSLVPSETPFDISFRSAGSFLQMSASLPRSRRVFLQMRVGSITTWLPTALFNSQSINRPINGCVICFSFFSIYIYGE